MNQVLTSTSQKHLDNLLTPPLNFENELKEELRSPIEEA